MQLSCPVDSENCEWHKCYTMSGPGMMRSGHQMTPDDSVSPLTVLMSRAQCVLTTQRVKILAPREAGTGTWGLQRARSLYGFCLRDLDPLMPVSSSFLYVQVL